MKPLQALTDEMLAKNIHVNDLSTITYNNNWGKMFDKYVEPEERKYPINYYSKSSGKLSLKVQTEDGITLKTIEEDAEAGLNTLNFNQAIDETQKEVYEKYLNSNKKAEEKEVKLAPADDKKIYFRPGKYQFVFEINGEKISKTLEIKAPEKRARRNMAPEPTASPEEFEEWYEEMGFEETKK